MLCYITVHSHVKCWHSNVSSLLELEAIEHGLKFPVEVGGELRRRPFQVDDVRFAPVNDGVYLNLFGCAIQLIGGRLVDPGFAADGLGKRGGWRGVTGIRGVVSGQVIFDERERIVRGWSGRFEDGICISLLRVFERDRGGIRVGLFPAVG